MILITACNSRYLGQIQPYLVSISDHFQFPAKLITVGFHADHHLIDSVELPRSQNYGSPYETESPQHGSFLNVFHPPEDEIIIFTDGDIILQRPLEEDEIELIRSVRYSGGVIVQYNSGKDETMTIEANRLFPAHPIERIADRFGFMDHPCYNVGVFITTKSTYERIYKEYMQRWNIVTEAFRGPARQQWLIVNCIHRLGIPVSVMPYSLHANGHYGMPPTCHYKDGLLCSGDRIVAFRHKL